MLPVIIGVAAVAGLIFAGCSENDDDGHSGVENDAGRDTGLDAAPDADADVAGDIDADSDTGVDADADADAETESGADGDTTPKTPFAPGANVYSDACVFPASITHNASDNRLYVACGGATNGLFKSPPLGTSGDWTVAGAVPGFPSNHAMIDERFAVVAYSMPDGFAIVDTLTNSVAQQVNFADLTILDEPGNPLSFTPNNPAGIVVAGGKIFIATSNLDQADFDHPENTTFHPGTLLSFDYNGDGTVDVGSAKAHITSCLNPTAASKIDDTTIAVLSSGSYDPATTEAELEICELPALDCTATQLGNMTAQASPVMPVTASGLILVGIQKPTNRLMGVDIATHAIALDREMPLVDNFISNNAAYGDVAVMSDFGIFGSGGQLLYAHTADSGWTGVPATPITWGSAGPSVVVGDMLYLTATSNNGSEGRIYEANLSGMD